MPVTGNNTSIYNLSIRITADGFSFFVTETISGDLIHREDFTIHEDEPLSRTLAKMLVRPTIQRLQYNKVRLVIDTDSTCIPLDEFKRDDLNTFYQLVFDNADLEANKVCYTVLPNLDVVELFTVPNDICDAISEIYPDVILTNSYATVMERTAAFCQRRNPANRPLFVYAQNKQLFVYCIYQNELLFANSFMVENGQTALYFLLSVWKELGLDVRENTCFIAGDPEPAKKLAEEARDYLLHVEHTNEVDLEHL